MPERENVEDQLRRAFVRQAPTFDLETSLSGRVWSTVRRRQRLRMTLAIVAAAAVVAAVAVPLSSLRSTPLGGRIVPATTPKPTPKPTPKVVGVPLSCNSLDLWNTPTGTAISTTTKLGQVAVTLTGTTATTPSQNPALSDPTLDVAVNDGGNFSEPVVPVDQTQVVIPWSIAPISAAAASTGGMPSSDALCLANFPGEVLPTVLLGLQTGGAHCCTVVRAISVTPTGLGPVVDDDVGNPAATLSSAGDQAQIVTADNTFAYAFADFAASAMPVKVLEFFHGVFVDVTKERPNLLTQDATKWFNIFTENSSNGLGPLAAWVADECLLGDGSSAWTMVNQLQSHNDLSGPSGWASGAAYVQELKSFLPQHGYCSS